MTETTARVPRRSDHDGRRLARHLAEMVAAMLVGMLLLDPVWRAGAAVLGGGDVLARADVAALLMATDMALGMAAWMWHRGHGRAATVEMVAAMYVPFLLLLPPWWAGLLGDHGLTLGGHLLMLPAMVLVALRHRHAPPARPRRHPVVVALARRWPTGLALLMTLDLWFAPAVLAPWTLLVLPAGYLLLGTVRRQWRDRRVLALQLAGLAGWGGLAAAALAGPDGVAGALVAAGWLGHAAWDLAHHRNGRVVPRAYAEWCGVLDAAVGITMVLALLHG
ncbi:hypothetical protein ONA91_11905 [Micromonospora sp. DR5-3]|uniref:hypothetical protein n=1 Tax=unclassified Micromonospora TaxID=2617518 RepID=UPI0011DB8270|nr:MULTISPECIES: hypothetical protein [unclassified Micromonospora]MCW3815159.1 hypothetical protein [Micromonospora sp. DR5-3]TYC19585.1 hypothetical protein FXF52_35835 [Micromonospora sp. MP36]